MSAKTGHVLGPRGSKSVFNITASDKSQIAVLMGMSASAHFLRPLIVFPGQRFTRNMLEGFDEAVLGRSENGWMDSELFVSWLQTVFIPDINERQVRRPGILLVDGHKTHVTLEASDICKDSGIVLYCLLEHASHLIQPCDLWLFSSLKESWKAALREWQIEHIGEYATKYEFSAIFKKAWVAVCKVENAVNAFRDAGLFPFNPEIVLSTDKFQTSRLFKKTKENVTTDETIPKESKDEPSEMLTATKVDANTVHETETSTMDRTENNNAADANIQSETILLEVNNPQDSGSTEQVIENQENNKCTNTIGNKGDSKNQTDEVESTSKEMSEPGIESDRKANAETKIESPMTKHLKIPEVKPKNKKFVKRDILPKAVTGEEFRRILLERKRKREEEEAAKKMRKVERERKKLEREKLKQEKQQQRLQKKKEKEEEKATKKRLKELVLQQRQKKSRESSDSESDCSMKDVNDDNDDEIGERYDANVCYKCDRTDDNFSGWIGCQNCLKFFHRSCTDIDFSGMTEEEIAEFPFECLYC